MSLFIGITGHNKFFSLSSIKKCIWGFDLVAYLEQSTFSQKPSVLFCFFGPYLLGIRNLIGHKICVCVLLLDLAVESDLLLSLQYLIFKPGNKGK